MLHNASDFHSLGVGPFPFWMNVAISFKGADFRFFKQNLEADLSKTEGGQSRENCFIFFGISRFCFHNSPKYE